MLKETYVKKSRVDPQLLRATRPSSSVRGAPSLAPRQPVLIARHSPAAPKVFAGWGVREGGVGGRTWGLNGGLRASPKILSGGGTGMGDEGRVNTLSPL